jgi:D-proline reductase (dithiol) PrdB
MVRLADLPVSERRHLVGKNLSPLGPAAWCPPSEPVNELRVALITTAGLHFRDDPAFKFTDATFRPIRADEGANNLVMSHSSVNFDKAGFSEDVNLVFPIERFRELEGAGRIGSLASVHYSFMGAGLNPEAYERSASQVAGLLKQDKVDAVFLTPV